VRHVNQRLSGNSAERLFFGVTKQVFVD